MFSVMYPWTATVETIPAVSFVSSAFLFNDISSLRRAQYSELIQQDHLPFVFSLVQYLHLSRKKGDNWLFLIRYSISGSALLERQMSGQGNFRQIDSCDRSHAHSSAWWRACKMKVIRERTRQDRHSFIIDASNFFFPSAAEFCRCLA